LHQPVVLAAGNPDLSVVPELLRTALLQAALLEQFATGPVVKPDSFHFWNSAGLLSSSTE